MADKYWLSTGSHATGDKGRCAMEWTSFIAGEPHSDQPRCVSPMLREFCIRLNDGLPDDQRQRMRPYLARCIGTSGDELDDSRRWLCADWLIRVYTPAWLDLVPSLKADAEVLRSLPPVLAAECVQRAMGDLNRARQNSAAAGDAAWAAVGDAARDAAWAAVGDAARDAAGAAAWDAAGAAAWAAVGDAAGDAAWAAARAAARAAAWDAARAAARDAAWAAVGDAAGAALAPVVASLQDSILSPGGLLDRMLPLELVSVPVVVGWRELCEVAQ